MYQTFQKSAERHWYVTKNQRNILNLHSKTMLDHKNAYAWLTFFPAFRLLLEVPWSILHLGERLCTFLSYAAPYFVMLHSWTMLHTAELYAAPYWATLQPTDIHCIIYLSYAAPSELHCTQWATLHPLSYAAPHWAALHSNLQYHTLLSYTAPAAELRCSLLSYAAACWATSHTHCK
jgi:hypothetical protein